MELKRENRDNPKSNFLELTEYLYDNLYFNDLIICLGVSDIDFRTQCVIMTQTRRPATLCHMRHSQNFRQNQ